MVQQNTTKIVLTLNKNASRRTVEKNTRDGYEKEKKKRKTQKSERKNSGKNEKLNERGWKDWTNEDMDDARKDKE